MSAYLGVGELLDGKYRIVRVIGEGGWGVVYEGEHARTLKRMAIKVLRSHEGVTADIRARFEREAQAAGRIGSPHIVEVFDLGVLADGTHFMVMELLMGDDLARRLRAVGPLSPIIAAKLMIQVLDGLTAAHAAGVFHRDLKPENLFLVRTRSGEDFVKILDFGVSKFSAPGDPSATRTGAVLGSPFYMAPEQARGLKHIDGRTDLYSVGALFFETVTGRVPFDGENFNDLMFKIALSPRPNPLHFNPSLDPALAALITKAIAADPRERFATAEEFRAALVGWATSQGIPSTRAPELHDAPRPPSGVGTPTESLGGTRIGWEERSPGRSASPRPSVPVDASRPSLPVAPPRASVPVDTAETPMASSSSRGGFLRRARRRPLFFIAMALGAGVIALAAMTWQRGHRVEDVATPPVATLPPAAPAKASIVDPPPAARLVEPPVESSAAPSPSPAPAAASAPAVTPLNAPPPSPATHWAPPPPAAHPASPAAAPPHGLPTAHPAPESSASAAHPPVAEPPPPPASNSPAAPFEKVEGREVRTRL